MTKNESRVIKYFNSTSIDDAWGIAVTTVGHQLIPPNVNYPRSQHPKSHEFNPNSGRILKEYQLIFITQGSGCFESKSVKKRKIEAGTMILLFPNEWHSYKPDKETGWYEYWVGFRGVHIDERVEKGFFSPKNPIYKIGFSSSIVGLYNDIINYAVKEKAGYQQIISSIVLYMLGSIYYKNKNLTLSDSLACNKINEARAIMKQEIENNISPEKIALDLKVSYSWFRKAFKQYVDVSPAQYQANLKYLYAKELLDTSDLNITEIAYKLNFESTSQFSTFFHKKEGISPSQYRKTRNCLKQ